LARTLKPMMAAFEAAARLTSDSVMPPTPDRMTRAATSSVPSFSSACPIASTEPCTSPLTSNGKTLRPSVWSWFIICSSEPRLPMTRAAAFSRFRRLR
jgi:hypothetical protein